MFGHENTRKLRSIIQVNGGDTARFQRMKVGLGGEEVSDTCTRIGRKSEKANVDPEKEYTFQEELIVVKRAQVLH